MVKESRTTKHWYTGFIKDYLLYKGRSEPKKHIYRIVDKINEREKRKLKILDIGSKTSPYFEKLNELGDVTTMDLTEKHNPDIVGDVHGMNKIANGEYDVVCLFMVMEHLHSPWIALRECNRILKGDGYLLITTPQYWWVHSEPYDYYRYTDHGLEYLCRESGFTIIDKWSMGGFWLIVFQTIQLNFGLVSRNPIKWLLFNILSIFFNILDKIWKNPKRDGCYDSIGWAIIAQKT